MAIITGNNKNSKVHGTPDADLISGLGGNDAIFGKGGNDTIHGGSSTNQDSKFLPVLICA